MKINIHDVWPITIMYLVIGSKELISREGGPGEKYFELTKVQPTEKFFEMVREEVRSHLKGKETPKEIATAIMNISDDLQSGRDPVLRAGDYIAMMDYARSKQII
jgi:hypothetical protein